MPANAECGQWLEDIADAIGEGRLYGYMMQQIADGALEASEWVEKTVEEDAAEYRADPENTPMRYRRMSFQ